MPPDGMLSLRYCPAAKISGERRIWARSLVGLCGAPHSKGVTPSPALYSQTEPEIKTRLLFLQPLAYCYLIYGRIHFIFFL